MKGARAHISVISHSDNGVFPGFLDLLYNVRTDWAEGQQQKSSWRHKISNILRLLYHITTKSNIQVFHFIYVSNPAGTRCWLGNGHILLKTRDHGAGRKDCLVSNCVDILVGH